MKKLILLPMILALSACATKVQQSSVPMDMQAVADYQARVMNAKANHVVAQQSEKWQLNSSDTRPKVVVRQPAIAPSIHYGRGWGSYRHHRYAGIGYPYY